MKLRTGGLVLWALIFLSTAASAVMPVFDINVFYFTDGLTYSNVESTYKRTFYDLTVAMPVTKSRRWVLGWNYGSMTFSDNPGTETSLKITDMGPKLMYYLNKDRTWIVGLTYNLISTGDYSSGATVTELRGTSMKFEAGYTPMMWENVMMGAKLNYYKATFKEEVTNQTSLSQVSNSRTTIYPSFSMTIRFD